MNAAWTPREASLQGGLHGLPLRKPPSQQLHSGLPRCIHYISPAQHSWGCEIMNALAYVRVSTQLVCATYLCLCCALLLC